MFDHNFKTKPQRREAVTMGQRILGFCFAIFAGALLLYLAVELLSQIWCWLIVAGVVLLLVWFGLALYRRWRDNW